MGAVRTAPRGTPSSRSHSARRPRAARRDARDARSSSQRPPGCSPSVHSPALGTTRKPNYTTIIYRRKLPEGGIIRLLSTAGSEDREVLGVGSIPVAILVLEVCNIESLGFMVDIKLRNTSW